MRKIRERDIIEVFKACPYCGYSQSGKMFCCGETHFVDAYLVQDEILFVDEVEILNPGEESNEIGVRLDENGS